MEEILGIPMGTIQNSILGWAKHVVFALLIFWIGMRVVKLMMRALNKALQLREVDPSLTTFLQSLVKIDLGLLRLVSSVSLLLRRHACCLR